STNPNDLADMLGEREARGALAWAMGALDQAADAVTAVPDIFGGVDEGGIVEMRGVLNRLAGGELMLGDQDMGPGPLGGGGGSSEGSTAREALHNALNDATGTADESAYGQDPSRPGTASDGGAGDRVIHVTNVPPTDTGDKVVQSVEDFDANVADIVVLPNNEANDAGKEDEEPESERGEPDLGEPWVEKEDGDNVYVTVTTWDEDFDEPVTSSEWMTKEEYEKRQDEYEKSIEPTDGEGSGDSEETTTGGEESDPSPAPDTEGQEIPLDGDNAGATPDNLEYRGPTYGLTQPEPAGEGSGSAGQEDEISGGGLAPLILTDPDQDQIAFLPPPKGSTYGLTQPPLVDETGGGNQPLPQGPTGGEIMLVYDDDPTFTGYQDGLF
ncbi:MAG: hypothetical protein AAFP78_07215, partial [Pseudomonadota bacterium]